MNNKIIQAAKIIILSAILTTGLSYLYAWSGPTSKTPPDENTPAPVNVSLNPQTKVGNLTLGGLSVGGNVLFDFTTALGGGLTIKDGNQAVGKILMSDVNGRATWAATSSLGVLAGGGGFIWNDLNLNSTSPFNPMCFYLYTLNIGPSLWGSSYVETNKILTYTGPRYVGSPSTYSWPGGSEFSISSSNKNKVSTLNTNNAYDVTHIYEGCPSSGTSSGGVSQIIAGSNITLNPTNGTGIVTINSSGGSSGGVTSITAGSGISVSASTGAVTISSVAGAGCYYNNILYSNGAVCARACGNIYEGGTCQSGTWSWNRQYSQAKGTTCAMCNGTNATY
ncbi:hypothetical protein IT397_01410 [Candidatus Nomurabacteria bacterium]|nr:hypothetical protein [Candidatus Nomurabacteria bacterium]